MFILFVHLISSKIYIGLTEERQFLNWMRTNNKFYTGDEYSFRLGIFISNVRYCQEFNRRNGLTFRLGVNQFSCHTPSEYKSLLGSQFYDLKTKMSKTVKPSKSTPDTFDWREKSVVNPIKNQGDCGSCWAFSTISTCESAFAISTGNLLQFSEQNLVDCSPGFGCRSGWTYIAVDYVLESQNGTFNSEDQYPYTAVDGSCVFDSSKAVGKITEVIYAEKDDENDLKEKVASLGVASISIHSGNTPFMSYAGGILDDDECTGQFARIDHAVDVVGYGSEDGIDFWIVRNSWGTSWGEEGYVRMVRNKGNKCFIATQAFIAVDSE